MGVDHRWGTREPLEKDVVIDCHRQMRRRGRIRDASLTGVFVAAPLAGLDINSPVEVVVVLRDNGVTWIRRVPAIVARLAPDGVGLTFTNLDLAESVRLLVRLRAGKGPADLPEDERRAAAPGKIGVTPADVSLPASAETRPSG